MKFDIGLKLRFEAIVGKPREMTQVEYYRLGRKGIFLGLFIALLIGSITFLQWNTLPSGIRLLYAAIAGMGLLIAVCGLIMRIRMRRFWFRQPHDLYPDRFLFKE